MKKITGNEQLDFQINRFTMNFKDDKRVQQDIQDMSYKIKSVEDWNKWWSKKALEYEQLGEFEIAANYYKAAMFYLIASSQRQKLYQSFIRCFYQYYDDFDYERGEVPYENGFLPTLYLKNKNATKTLLVIGGFDSYLEEVATFFKYMRGTNYNMLIFDGPGQGNTSYQGLKFVPNFEKPVGAILDYYNLENVAAIGLSWGGYLVMRAAAFEKRITKVIAMDIFYSPMDTVKMNVGLMRYGILNILLKYNQIKLVNNLFDKLAKENIDLTWKLTNGYQLTEEKTPFDLIKNLKRHNVKNILPLVNQDCLLLAGREDIYVPVSRLKTIKKGLISSSRIESKIFDSTTGGEKHCQIGHMDLAFERIINFLDK
ncbi:alpha/beta hydrolase [Companilactobacillus musae]|uniref:alpha/beta fold hydrolase n=1 Tax=Companilactobacillus musae TaxID=1903258 RepID=UPI000E65CBB8|nr:alpha/beta hydrolase [Companilactobacillus musae]